MSESEANNGSAACAPDTVAEVSENKNNFLDARWKALEQKQFADCSFLVGPENGETEVRFGVATCFSAII